MSANSNQKTVAIGRETVIQLSVVIAIIGAVFYFATMLGGIKQEVSALTNSEIEKRLTTIEVETRGVKERLAEIAGKLDNLTRRAGFPSHLWPTSAETREQSDRRQERQQLVLPP
jgi:hypothetical protein